MSLPRHIPLVILRGSGETTAALARLAAENGVRTLAHAEGGGVLYVHGSADPDEGARAGRRQPRPARGLQPPEPPPRRSRGGKHSFRGCSSCSSGKDSRCGATVDGALPLDRPLGYEWAGDPERVGTVTVALVDGVDDAVRVANDETSGLAAGIVAEDADAAERFLDGYRGTAAFWHATTRFTDGFELTGAPETGINVDWAPGPRGPVTYRDLWLRQYRVVGDGTQQR